MQRARSPHAALSSVALAAIRVITELTGKRRGLSWFVGVVAILMVVAIFYGLPALAIRLLSASGL